MRLDPGPALGVLGPVGPEELGEVHEVRADGVDLHALAGDLGGHVADEHVGAGPRRRVQRRAGRGPGAGGAGEDEHLPFALLDHHRHDGAEEVVRSLDAAGECGTEVVDRRIGGSARRRFDR